MPPRSWRNAPTWRAASVAPGYLARIATDTTAARSATTPGAAPSARATDLTQLQGWYLSSVWSNEDVVLKFTHPHWARLPRPRTLSHRDR